MTGFLDGSDSRCPTYDQRRDAELRAVLQAFHERGRDSSSANVFLLSHLRHGEGRFEYCRHELCRRAGDLLPRTGVQR